MQKIIADLVIESVRYLPTGQIDFVRLYERRGSTYSDRIMYTREQLVQALNRKKKAYTGQRIARQAATFDLGLAIRLLGSPTALFITTASDTAERDQLQDTPLQ